MALFLFRYKKTKSCNLVIYFILRHWKGYEHTIKDMKRSSTMGKKIRMRQTSFGRKSGNHEILWFETNTSNL